MRHAEALAKLPEHKEFMKKDLRRGKYAKQAANVRARRASLKQGETTITTDSMSSRVQGDASSSHACGTQREMKSNNRFEVFSSMPMGVEEATCSTGDASSASTHFKRKKPRK
jgi:hypothetical protein